MRNIFFAPISEEFAFRALMIPALCAAYYFSGSDETINSNSSDNNRVDYNKFDSIDVNSFNPKSEINESNAINTQKTEITMSLIFTVLRTSYNIFTYYCVPALSTYSPWKVVLTCPLWFVLAHVHHCVEKIKNGQTVKQAILSKFSPFRPRCCHRFFTLWFLWFILRAFRWFSENFLQFLL